MIPRTITHAAMVLFQFNFARASSLFCSTTMCVVVVVWFLTCVPFDFSNILFFSESAVYLYDNEISRCHSLIPVFCLFWFHITAQGSLEPLFHLFCEMSCPDAFSRYSTGLSLLRNTQDSWILEASVLCLIIPPLLSRLCATILFSLLVILSLL